MPLTAHEVVNKGIDGTVSVAEPMRQQRKHGDYLTLLHFNCVSVGDGDKEKRESMSIWSISCILTPFVKLVPQVSTPEAVMTKV